MAAEKGKDVQGPVRKQSVQGWSRKSLLSSLLSLVIRETQIKVTMRHHLMPVRMAVIKKSTNHKCLRGFEK